MCMCNSIYAESAVLATKMHRRTSISRESKDKYLPGIFCHCSSSICHLSNKICYSDFGHPVWLVNKNKKRFIHSFSFVVCCFPYPFFTIHVRTSNQSYYGNLYCVVLLNNISSFFKLCMNTWMMSNITGNLCIHYLTILHF